MERSQRSDTPNPPDDLPSNLDSSNPPAAITCPICFDVYEEPKLLNCGHTVCLKCVQELARLAEEEHRDIIFSSPKFSCPECRALIPVSATGTLRTNFRLADVIQQFKAMKTEQAKSSEDRPTAKTPTEPLMNCTHCSEEVKQKHIFICLSCPTFSAHEGFLCGTCCVNLHNGHRLSPLDQMTNAQERQQFTSEIMGKVRQMKVAFDEHFLKSKDSKKELANMISSCIEHSLNASGIEKLPGNNRTTKEDLTKFQIIFSNLTTTFGNVMAQLKSLEYDFEEQLRALMTSFENEYKGQVAIHFPSNGFSIDFGPNHARQQDNVFIYNSSPRSRIRRPRRNFPQRTQIERQWRNSIPGDDEEL